ncbi:MAG: hypothetical protein ACTSU5_06750 [Promethearchaeota archaeon]
MGKPWSLVKGENNLFFRTKCGHCNEIKPPSQLYLVVEGGDSSGGSLGRRVGKLQILCGECYEKDPERYSWVKKMDGVTYDDVKTLMKEHRLVMMTHGKDLFIDFSIIVCNYRDDVRFQSF